MGQLNLRHYSRGAVQEVKPAVQPNPAAGKLKPRGFWVSVGDAWAEWCRQNSFGPPAKAPDELFVYRVVLDSSARILAAGTAEETEALVEEYGIKLHPDLIEARTLDWKAISQDGYDGIILTEYLYGAGLRREPRGLWYYGWDCASGCIWGGQEVVESLELVRRPTVEPAVTEARKQGTSEGS